MAGTSRSRVARRPSRRTRKRRSASPTGATSRSGGATNAAFPPTTTCRTMRLRNARCSTGSSAARAPSIASKASSARREPPPTTSWSSATPRSTSSCSASARTVTSPRCSRTRRRCEQSKRVLPAEPGLEPFVDRVTLSIPTLNSAREIVFARLRGREGRGRTPGLCRPQPSPETPASLVRAHDGSTTAILDRAAAAKLRA